MIYISLFLTVLLSSISLAFVSPVMVLRKESMVVDAISHSVLPGIVFAYLLSGSLNSILFDFISIFFTFFITLFLNYLFKSLTLSKESIIGLVYSFLFSIGIILINVFARDVHLDADSVLFGQLEYTLFDTVNLFGFSFFTLAHVKLFFIVSILFIWYKFFSRDLILSAFDNSFIIFSSRSIKFLEYFYYLLLSIILIQSFKIMGVVLVLSLAVVPAMIAQLFAKNVGKLFRMSIIFSVLSSLISVIIAFIFDISITGTIAFVNLLFLISAVVLKNYFLNEK